MDRETLIQKIKSCTDEYNDVLETMQDEDLMHLYNNLEDLGYEVSYSD